MAARQPKKPKKKSPARRSNIIRDTRYGRWLSLGFFRQNAWIVLMLLVSLLALMGLRYQTKTKMETIKELNTDLKRAESRMLREKAEYMTLIRESEMRRLVHEKGLGLEFQEQPPFEITADK